MDELNEEELLGTEGGACNTRGEYFTIAAESDSRLQVNIGNEIDLNTIEIRKVKDADDIDRSAGLLIGRYLKNGVKFIHNPPGVNTGKAGYEFLSVKLIGKTLQIHRNWAYCGGHQIRARRIKIVYQLKSGFGGYHTQWIKWTIR